jgi:uncharacterized protein (DUF488 family)
MPKDLLIYTIGHSDHTIAELSDLLKRYHVARVVDVRSQPYSRWAFRFNRETLAQALKRADFAYTFMGDSLGGRPDDQAMYDPGEERPNYERMENTPVYQAGVERLLQLAQAEQVAIMCSEGDHRHCHRHLLLTQTLLERGATVIHIQPDGTQVSGEATATQLSLFG